MDKRFTVVGVFESQGGAFESEIWGDVDVMGAMFQRGAGSNSVVVRMKDPSQVPRPRQVDPRPARRCSCRPCRSPSTTRTRPGPSPTILKACAAFVAFVMGVGAVFGAMNTMYAIVARAPARSARCARSASRDARSCARS